jgi:hypothetical protein
MDNMTLGAANLAQRVNIQFIKYASIIDSRCAERIYRFQEDPIKSLRKKLVADRR